MKITYVKADDWAGIYIDDDLYTEGHSIPHFEWIRLLQKAGIEVDDSKGEADETYRVFEEFGRCPSKLSEWPVREEEDLSGGQ